MKYSININQKKAVEWELTSSEAIVFSWIYELASWADKMEYKGKTYYYGSKNKACEELPIITNKRDTMYRIFKSLQGKGLIELITLDKSDYLALTKKGKEWYNNKGSEKNPSYGNDSKETELNPINNNTREEKNNIKEDTNVSKKKTKFEEEIITNEDYIKFRSWMKDNCPFCNNPKNFSSSIINQEEFLKLKDLYTGKEIADVILEIENRKDLRKKYSNLYRTVLNWLRNNNKNNNNGSNNKYNK